MKMRTASEQESKLGSGSKPEIVSARYRKWWRLASVLLCLLGLNATVRNARADTISRTNNNAITTPDSGPATLYPSEVLFSNSEGRIRNVRVTLHNISHTFPDDYDILLVGPGGQSAILMSDCGGTNDLNDVTITFSSAGSPLPDSAQITPGHLSSDELRRSDRCISAGASSVVLIFTRCLQ